MGELFEALGVNLSLLLSQGVNFLIVLIVLTVFVYRPLTRLLDERKNKIEIGLRVAEEAEKRLKEIDDLKNVKMVEADREALALLARTEKQAEEKSRKIIKEGAEKAEEIIKSAEETGRRKMAEELDKFTREAGGVIREALAKAVMADPEEIDEKLVKNAVRLIKEQKISL